MVLLTFSPSAEADLEEIGDFIAQDNLAAASAFIQRLRQRCDSLVTFPSMGRKRDQVRVGYRSVTEGDYVIFYRMENDNELVIMHVFHGKRDLGKMSFAD